MRIERALRLRDSVISGLRDCYSAASIYGMKSADMEVKRHEVLGRLPPKTPQWVRQFADGYWRCMIDGAYRHDLVFGGIVDGQFYSTHSDRDDYYEKHGIEPCEYADDGKVTSRGHYWKRNLKPFFVDKPAA